MKKKWQRPRLLGLSKSKTESGTTPGLESATQIVISPPSTWHTGTTTITSSGGTSYTVVQYS
jgi:hypothetical protein